MTGLIFGLCAFGMALAVYAVLARTRRTAGPGSTRLSTLSLLLVVVAVVIMLSTLFPVDNALDEAAVALLVAFSLVVAFTAANTAIETDSPTQSLVLFLHRHGGADASAIEAFANERSFRDLRLDGLIKDGLVGWNEGRLVCRPAAYRVLHGLDFYLSLIHI